MSKIDEKAVIRALFQEAADWLIQSVKVDYADVEEENLVQPVGDDIYLMVGRNKKIIAIVSALPSLEITSQIYNLPKKKYTVGSLADPAIAVLLKVSIIAMLDLADKITDSDDLPEEIKIQF